MQEHERLVYLLQSVTCMSVRVLDMQGGNICHLQFYFYQKFKMQLHSECCNVEQLQTR